LGVVDDRYSVADTDTPRVLVIANAQFVSIQTDFHQFRLESIQLHFLKKRPVGRLVT
jgi:hypothetical protein